MVHMHPRSLTTSAIFLEELFLQLCPDPNQANGEAEKKPYITSVFSLKTLPGQFTGWFCNWGDKWKGLGEKETISWGLLILAQTAFCPNGWDNKAPTFPPSFCVLLICISKVKSLLCPHRTCPCLLSLLLTHGLLPVPHWGHWALQLRFQYYVSVVSSAHSFFCLCHRNNLVLQEETKRILKNEHKTNR